MTDVQATGLPFWRLNVYNWFILHCAIIWGCLEIATFSEQWFISLKPHALAKEDWVTKRFGSVDCCFFSGVVANRVCTNSLRERMLYNHQRKGTRYLFNIVNMSWKTHFDMPEHFHRPGHLGTICGLHYSWALILSWRECDLHIGQSVQCYWVNYTRGTVWVAVAAHSGVRLPKGCNCILPFPAGTDLSLSNENQVHFEQYRKAALQGEVQMLWRQKYQRWGGELPLLLYHHCGVWHHLLMVAVICALECCFLLYSIVWPYQHM